MENRIFYVYVYSDPTKFGPFKYGNHIFHCEPFYVGKGKFNRYLSHARPSALKNDFTSKSEKIKEILSLNKKPIITKILENLEEQESLNAEIDLIYKIGREATNSGPLLNLTDGGDGVVNITDTTRQKMSLAKRGKYLGKNNPNWGGKYSLRGVNHPNYNGKLGQRGENATKAKFHYIVKSPTGEIFETNCLKEFCESNNLSASAMICIANKKPSFISHKGWTVISKTNRIFSP